LIDWLIDRHVCIYFFIQILDWKISEQVCQSRQQALESEVAKVTQHFFSNFNDAEFQIWKTVSQMQQQSSKTQSADCHLAKK